MTKTNLFDNPDFDEQLYQKHRLSPQATHRYVIFFTARSGSTWLTDIASGTGRLGRPNEAFSPGTLPKRAQGLNVKSLDQFIDIRFRRRASGDVHGVEMTYHHLNAVFESDKHFMGYFKDNSFIWLIRENPVAQAISLAKMVSTGVGNTAVSTSGERKSADTSFEYDGALIKHWLMHNRTAEISTEKLFDRYDLKPLRLSYERMTRVPAFQLLTVMAHHIGIEPIPRKSIVQDSNHAKLGTSKNSAFEDRFRTEHADFVNQIEEDRQPMLDKLTRLNKVFKSLKQG